MLGSQLMGENLWIGGPYNPSNDVHAVSAWENEKKDYTYPKTFNDYLNGPMVGHYTQMVNKRVKQIGCGCTQCPNNKKMCVCRYDTIQYGTEIPY